MAGTTLAQAESIALGALSQSTGSILIDTAIGGAVGYAMAPKKQKYRYAVGGAVATGLAGVFGLLATAAFALANQRDGRR